LLCLCYMCVLILLYMYMCPHTATYVSHTAVSDALQLFAVFMLYVSSCYMCVLIPCVSSCHMCVLTLCVSSYCYMCIYVSSYCCIFVSYCRIRRTRTLCCADTIYVSSCCYVYVLILLHRCPHTAIHVSSYCYVCVDTQPYPTHSNFVLCEVVDTDAKGLVDYLRKRGAYARVC
jgi:hypothetical protein